jgi:hypothetical protein
VEADRAVAERLEGFSSAKDDRAAVQHERWHGSAGSGALLGASENGVVSRALCLATLCRTLAQLCSYIVQAVQWS